MSRPLALLLVLLVSGCLSTAGDSPAGEDGAGDVRRETGVREDAEDGAQRVKDGAAFEAQTDVKMIPLCFIVTNAVGGIPGAPALQHPVRGLRYASENVTSEAPALVFTAGGGMGASTWEATPTFSMPRMLAARGYAVFVFDRLGEGLSRPTPPVPAYPTTFSGHFEAFREIVQQVKAGTALLRTEDGPVADAADCTSTPLGLAHGTVVVGGHSLGGAFASGYVARYPSETAGLIQMDFSSHGFNVAFLDMIGRTIQKYADQEYGHFPYARDDCDTLFFYPPGVNASIRGSVLDACNPDFIPRGLLHSLPEAIAEHQAIIQEVPAAFPVLLTYADYSFPYQDTENDPQAEETDAWRTRVVCQTETCDVTDWMQADTNHSWFLHDSMPTWVETVHEWLAARELAPP